MMDTPEEIAKEVELIARKWRHIPSHNRDEFRRDISQALLFERRKQIERDAKIAEEYQRLARSVMECDCSQEATAYGILAAAIRSQEPK